MASAADIQGVVFKQGSAILLARVVKSDGSLVQQADLESASYTAYLLDAQDVDVATAVEGHEDVELEVSGLIYDELQTGDLWDVDETGYNFQHELDVSENQVFATAGRNYRIVFTLVPSVGQPILVRFRVAAI